MSDPTRHDNAIRDTPDPTADAAAEAAKQLAEAERMRRTGLRLVAAAVIVIYLVTTWLDWWDVFEHLQKLFFTMFAFNSVGLVALLWALFQRRAWLRMTAAAATVGLCLIVLCNRLAAFANWGWLWTTALHGREWTQVCACALGLMSIRLYGMELALYRQSLMDAPSSPVRVPEIATQSAQAEPSATAPTPLGRGRRNFLRLVTLLGMLGAGILFWRSYTTMAMWLNPIGQTISFTQAVGYDLVTGLSAVLIFLPRASWRIFAAGLCAAVIYQAGIPLINEASMDLGKWLYFSSPPTTASTMSWLGADLPVLVALLWCTGLTLRWIRAECNALTPPGTAELKPAVDEEAEFISDGTWDEARNENDR